MSPVKRRDVTIDSDYPGMDYLQKIAEGKTPEEVRRALNRCLSNVLCRQIYHAPQAAA
jgi:hypothetical protein